MLEDDNQIGAGQVDDSQRGPAASSNGGNMNNTLATDDTLHDLSDKNELEAARATEKTQQQVGNSKTRGDANHSKSRTTENQVIR